MEDMVIMMIEMNSWDYIHNDDDNNNNGGGGIYQ